MAKKKVVWGEQWINSLKSHHGGLMTKGVEGMPLLTPGSSRLLSLLDLEGFELHSRLEGQGHKAYGDCHSRG